MLTPNEITITSDLTADEVKGILADVDHIVDTSIEEKESKYVVANIKPTMTTSMPFPAQSFLHLPQKESAA